MDDLISRQAALAEAYNVVIDGSVFKVVQVETLYGLPTIEPVKHGKWEPAIVARNIDALECSECGAKYPNLLWMPGYNYCPNCGARMDL